MRRNHWFAVCSWLCACCAPMARGDDASGEVQKLKERVHHLEARVAELERLLEPMKDRLLAAARQMGMQQKVAKRFEKDRETYTEEEMAEVEKIYQEASKKWGTDEMREGLERLIDEFPGTNRSGCAMMYLAQWAKDRQREEYLKTAIEVYDDCFYGDGVQVGGYARFLLGCDCRRAGDNQRAQKLFDEIRQKYPKAVDHSGKLLVDLIR